MSFKKIQIEHVTYVLRFGGAYKIDNNGGLALIPNQPFKPKREALRVLGIHLSVLNKHLNSFKEYKGLLIFSFSQALPHPSAEHVVGPGERIMTHAGVAPKDAWGENKVDSKYKIY